jgi:hypothetical protein
MDFKCRHCGEAIERRESDDRPGTMEWVTKFGNDPQCDASPSDNHGPAPVKMDVANIIQESRDEREAQLMNAVQGMKTVSATQLTRGQYIVNVGQIVGTRADGAFVFVSIEGQAWDAARGIEVPTFEVKFLHASDEVVVVG